MVYCIKSIIDFINKKKEKNMGHVVDNACKYGSSIETYFERSEEQGDDSLTIYDQKESLVTMHEKYFYDIFEKNFGAKYKIQTQVNLASVVNKTDNSKYQNELFRNIDFGFFDKETLKPLLLVEINDSTHKIKSRYERDLKVREILRQAKIKLITFYSFYDNKEEYIVNKILESLE